MRTFKQWLVRKYGTATVKVTPKIVTKSANTTPAKTRGSNS
jgi:hypothetical protein